MKYTLMLLISFLFSVVAEAALSSCSIQPIKDKAGVFLYYSIEAYDINTSPKPYTVILKDPRDIETVNAVLDADYIREGQEAPFWQGEFLGSWLIWYGADMNRIDFRSTKTPSDNIYYEWPQETAAKIDALKTLIESKE